MKAVCVAVLVLAALAGSPNPAAADPFFTGNPWSPIPPGCVTRPDLQTALYGDSEVVVYEGESPMLHAEALRENAQGQYGTRIPADLRISRYLCAEPNRSALIVQFGFPDSLPYTNQAQYLRPGFWAKGANGDTVGWFTPIQEPSTALAGQVPDRMGQPVFGDFADGWEYLGDVKWTYLLDLTGPLQGYASYTDRAAEAYNREMNLYSELMIWDEPLVPWRIPATPAAGPVPTRMPLTGRHTGTWIIEGAADQGVTLSFSNRVPRTAADAGKPEWAPLFLFLTWYTFDTEGHGLWLTGSGEFPQGADSVDLELTSVRGGAFLGTRPAQRSAAGQATLSARSCNDLVLEFDLSGLGLGAGSQRLQRLHDLEVAGYNCRDHDARRQSAFGAAH